MDQLDRGLRQHVNERQAKGRTAASFGTSGDGHSSRQLTMAIAIIVLVVVVLVALMVYLQDRPTVGPEGVGQLSEERGRVTLVRPPAWIPADRLAAPSPASR